MANFTTEQVKELHGAILGTELDPADFISTGPVPQRTVLTTDEKIITRAINAINTSNNQSLGMVDAFTGRFNNIVGNEIEGDKEAHQTLDGSLIQVVSKLKGAVDVLQTMEGSFNILGNYETYEDLKEAHPVGKVGNAYIVSGSLFVW